MATLTQGYRGFIQGKTRITLAWVFAGALVFFARSYPSWPGILVAGLGATLRFWASGYLRKDSRPAVGGPYAFVRNPLYLGTYLMAVGAALAVGNGKLLAVASVLFAAIYHFIILDEETKLERIFGEPYLTYLKLVPRFFPRAWPPLAPAPAARLASVNPEPGHRAYSWDIAMKNKAHEAYLSLLGIVGFLYVVAYGWQNF